MTNVLTMLEKQAKKYPDKIAFEDENSSISFAKLLELSKQGGSHLAGKNVQKCAVAIYMKKSCYCIAAMLCTIQAGGFYSIIDLELPKHRKQKMCELLDAKAVICDDALFSEAKNIFIGFNVIKASKLFSCQIDEALLKKIKSEHISTDALYCNFTSGSTGVPKGVIISHASVIDFIGIFTKTLGLKSTDIFANQAPFDFDVSVKDIYSTLFLGAKALLIPRGYFTKPMVLMDFISSANIYIWAVSALVFLNTTKALAYKKPKIEKIIYSGEIMPIKHLIKLRQDLPKTKFINVYGPSEITCNCTFHILKNNDFKSNENIIGKTFSNRHVFLLDDKGCIVTKAYEVGEICISGICLALGYLNGDESAFCKDYKGQRFYKSGDLGFYNDKNLLCIKGRKDFQIKRMGHRIELAEIESMAQECYGVLRACAIYENEKLCLFFEGEQNERFLSEFLRQNLPFYMIPNQIIKKEHLGINKNGKIDRNSLKMELQWKK